MTIAEAAALLGAPAGTVIVLVDHYLADDPRLWDGVRAEITDAGLAVLRSHLDAR